MSGWIKVEKELVTDPRFLRLVKAVRHADVTLERISSKQMERLVLGSLVDFWMYVDTHLREDDTLDLGADEIDELVGITGFTKILPADWLEIIDAHRVKLPGFHVHNGTDAKKKALATKRQQRQRIRNGVTVPDEVSRSSVTGALPDRDRDLDQKRPEKSKSEPARDVPHGTGDSVEQLFAKSLQEWRAVEGVSHAAGDAWIEHCQTNLSPPKILAGLSRIAMAKTLAGMGDAATQEAAVNFCIAGGFKNLRHADGASAGGKPRGGAGGKEPWRPDPEEEARAKARLRPAAGGR